MSEYKDFDAAISEEVEDTLEFKIAGREYEVPAQLPARVVLMQLTLQNESGELNPNDMTKWLGALLGDQILNDMLESGVGWKQLEELLGWVLVEYGVIQNQSDLEVTEGTEEDPK